MQIELFFPTNSGEDQKKNKKIKKKGLQQE